MGITTSPRGATRLPPPAALAAFCALVYLGERRWPLRRRREPTARRWARNAIVAASGAAAALAFEHPLAARLSARASARRWGLAGLGLPPWIERALAVLLLDYTLYVWHVLTHRVPFLWRFHRVHHADRDLDASTALRFHFGELALSAPFRALQIAVIGVSPEALAIWRALLLASITFHHANLRLPRRIDRLLAAAIVTPRLHGLHHARRAARRACNWSSGLTLWDRLHGTLRLEGEALRAGLDDLPRRRDVTTAAMLALPFRRRAP